MSEEPVTLELLGRLVRGLQDQMGEFRDQMTVQTSILLRLEAAQNSTAEQLRAMASQHQLAGRRLLALDDRIRARQEERR